MSVLFRNSSKTAMLNGNPASKILKLVHTKKLDVRHRPGMSNVCNTLVCIRKVKIVAL